MSNEKTTPNLPTGSDPQIDRVRELILGPHLRETGQHFQDMGRDLARLQQEFDRLTQQVAEQEQEHSKRLQALRTEARDGDNTLRTELRDATQQLNTDKMDRSALGELFIELGNQIKAGGSLGSILADLLNGE